MYVKCFSLALIHTQQSKMTVKVHYSTTRALRINISAKFHELEQGICKKFGCPLGSLTFYSKKRDGELLEVHDEASLKELTSNLEDGFRLTLWAYDKHEVGFATMALFDAKNR